MAVRRKTVLILTVCAVMASISIHVQRPSRGGQRPGDRPEEGRGGDWSLVITPGGMFEISHKGAPIVHTAFHFWGKRWAYAGPSLRCDPDGPRRWHLSGQVPGLKLKLSGWLRSTASNVIQMEMLIRAEQEMSDVIGGGFQWDLNLNSPSLRGRAAGPELLPDNRGWTWRVGEGETIALRFDEPAARVYFERNQKHTIRTFLVGDRIQAGTRRIRMTLQLPEGASLKPSPEERYGRTDLGRWFRGALAPDAAPVDLSFLNRDDRPAGRRGFVRTDGDRMVFADGVTARFWGGNLAAMAIFLTP